MSNTCTFRITASAGTKLHGALNNLHRIFSYLLKFTTNLPSILHEISLDQDCSHCPIFHTAASYEFRPYLSSDAVGRSFKPTKSRRLGKLLIPPTITYLNRVIYWRINLYVLSGICRSLSLTSRQNSTYYSPVRYVSNLTFNLHNVKYISSVHSEPES